MRIFIAFNIDEMILDKIQKIVKELESFSSFNDIKFIPKKNMHVTIKFIGEFQKEKLDNLIQNLKEINFSSIDLKVKGIGSFGNIKKAKVLWAGIEEINSKEKKLINLSRDIDNKLLKFKIEPEKRDFLPHLTLARVKTTVNNKIIDYFSKNKDIEFGSFILNEFILYESILKSTGPEYREIEKFVIK